MNFVKSSVYLHEITSAGVQEKEVDTRDPEERKAYERLRQLPEFTTDPNYKSLAEQLQENEQMQYPEASDEPYPYAPSRLTVEDAEFFEQLEREELRRKKLLALDEELELQEFRSQMKNLSIPHVTQTDFASDPLSSCDAGEPPKATPHRPSVQLSVKKNVPFDSYDQPAIPSTTTLKNSCHSVNIVQKDVKDSLQLLQDYEDEDL